MTLDDSTPEPRRRHHHPRRRRRLRIGGGVGESGGDAADAGDVERHGDRPGRDRIAAAALGGRCAARRAWPHRGGNRRRRRHHRRLPARRRVQLHAGADRRRASQQLRRRFRLRPPVRRRTWIASRWCAARRARLFGSNAIGAVVRITSRRGGPPSAGIAVETGQFGSSRVTASTAGSHQAFEWGASFDQLDSDGMNGERAGNGLTVANDDYTRRAGTASAGWRRGGSWVRGDLHHAVDERGFPGPFGSNPAGIYTGIDLDSRGDNTRTVGGVSFFTPLSTRLGLRGQTGFNKYDSDFASPFGDVRSDSRAGGTAARSSTSPWARGSTSRPALPLERERAGSTYITGASAQEVPVKRFNRRVLRRRPLDLERARLRHRRRPRRRHPARAAGRVAGSVLAQAGAAGRHGGLGQPAARRCVDRRDRPVRDYTKIRGGVRHRHPSARWLRARVHRQSRPAPRAQPERRSRRRPRLRRRPRRRRSHRVHQSTTTT